MFKKYLSLNLLVLVLFIADRILKLYFLKNPTKEIGGDFFKLNFETNTGMAFGLSINQIALLVLIVIILIALINILVRAYFEKNLLEIFTITLIIAGAISNLIDRLRYGFVIDYIYAAIFCRGDHPEILF